MTVILGIKGIFVSMTLDVRITVLESIMEGVCLMENVAAMMGTLGMIASVNARMGIALKEGVCANLDELEENAVFMTRCLMILKLLLTTMIANQKPMMRSMIIINKLKVLNKTKQYTLIIVTKQL